MPAAASNVVGPLEQDALQYQWQKVRAVFAVAFLGGETSVKR